MLAAPCGMMHAVQRRGDENLGKRLVPGESDVCVVEEHEEHSHDLADHHDFRLHAEDDRAEAFETDFHELIGDVETQAGRHIEALVAVVHLVKAPEKLVLMPEVVPEIHGEIEEHEACEPFQRAIGHSGEQSIASVILGHDEQARNREQAHDDVVEKEGGSVR